MSSPLIKISDQSWSLCCLCCNCAQEVKDIIKMVVGAAFVEYNHRFTCPHCQTYNQILLTRDMFETAQPMTFSGPPVVSPQPQPPLPPEPPPSYEQQPGYGQQQSYDQQNSYNPGGYSGYSPDPAGYSPNPGGYNPDPGGYNPDPGGFSANPNSFSSDPGGFSNNNNYSPGGMPSFESTPPSPSFGSTDSPGGRPSFESMGNDAPPFNPAAPFNSGPSSFTTTPPPVFNAAPPAPVTEFDKFDPPMPAPEKPPETSTPRVGAPSFESVAPAKKSGKSSGKAKDDDEIDVDGIYSSDLFSAGKTAKDKGDKKKSAEGGSKLPSSITVAGREIPVNNQTMAIAGGALLAGLFLLYSFWPASKPPTPPPTTATNAAKTPTPGATPKPNTSASPQPLASATPLKVEAKMVDIPAGEYTIGSNDGGEFERPVHKVDIKGFKIDIREVNREEYAAFVKATGHKAPSSWPGGVYKGSGLVPVTDIDWEDAQAYAKWAGKRLPTEAEWEAAASGKEHLVYPWGNQWTDGRANTKEAGRDGPQPAGSFPKNTSPFGLLDMCGNVWEWTASQPEAYPGAGSKIPNPEQLRVIRGGSYTDTQKIVTNSARNWVESNRTNAALGFRCAKDGE